MQSGARTKGEPSCGNVFHLESVVGAPVLAFHHVVACALDLFEGEDGDEGNMTKEELAARAGLEVDNAVLDLVACWGLTGLGDRSNAVIFRDEVGCGVGLLGNGKKVRHHRRDADGIVISKRQAKAKRKHALGGFQAKKSAAFFKQDLGGRRGSNAGLSWGGGAPLPTGLEKVVMARESCRAKCCTGEPGRAQMLCAETMAPATPATLCHHSAWEGCCWQP